jgi:hypothetical protein
MEAEAVRFSSRAIVLAQCRGRGEAEPDEVVKELCIHYGIREGDVTVSRHRPENFLAVFKYPHHREAALEREKL